MLVDNEFDFKRRLRDMMDSRGLTQAQLGDRIGETSNVISNWMMQSGKSLPNLRKFRLICIALNCFPGDLLGLSSAELSDREAQFLKRLKALDEDGMYLMESALDTVSRVHSKSDG